MTHKNNSAKHILNQIHSLVTEAEESLVERGTDAYESLRERAEAVQERVSEAYDGAKKTVVAGARQADKKIRDNPYETAAIAAGVGLLIGFALGRRSNR